MGSRQMGHYTPTDTSPVKLVTPCGTPPDRENGSHDVVYMVLETHAWPWSTSLRRVQCDASADLSISEGWVAGGRPGLEWVAGHAVLVQPRRGRDAFSYEASDQLIPRCIPVGVVGEEDQFSPLRGLPEGGVLSR